MARAAQTQLAATAPKRGLFAYIWRNSRREQLIVLAVVLLSLPFYFISLDLPRSIVNDAIQGRAFPSGAASAAVFHFTLARPGFLGGGTWFEFPGFPVTRFGYLLALSLVFLALVLINGAFKYIINMRKGALGERLLRQLRLDLFTQLLAMTPESIANIKPSEAATIIKDEVEPIGGFVGEAFIQPVFLATQALTALAFILLQSWSLGLLTGAIVLVQGLVIPRLRREQLRLGKERQALSRALAGRIGEVVEAMPEVDNHAAAGYERGRVAVMLDQLFAVRYRLYDRKFRVRFLNNLLAQVTPFLFYSIGGYYALAGSLDIGQLVAVIAAYRELPPPLKELIDWDQQRQDVALKFELVMEQFGASPAATEPTSAPAAPVFAGGAIETQGLGAVGPAGDALLESINLALPAGAHVALHAHSGEGTSVLARVIGRRITTYSGSVRIGGQDLRSLPAEMAGRVMAYAGTDPIVFPGTLRGNLLYGLNHAAFADAGATQDDEQIIAALRVAGLDEAVYRFGLGRRLDPEREGALAARIVKARRALGAALAASGAQDLIENFAPQRYSKNAAIGENLLFGVARAASLADETLAEHPAMRSVLDATGLTPALVGVGRRIAAAMIEIFADLPGSHFLFEQFSFVSPSEIAVARDMLARADARGGGDSPAHDRARLIAFALRYIEPRHRLGLLTPDLERRIVEARAQFREAVLAQAKAGQVGASVDFYDPERFCAAAPLRDNLLFGRIAHGIGGGARRVHAALRGVLCAEGLDNEVFRLGLDQPAGPSGRNLQPDERRALVLARCLVKQPEILILDQPLPSFDDIGADSSLTRIRALMAGKTLLAVIRDPAVAASFGYVVKMDGPRVVSAGPAAQQAPAEDVASPAPQSEGSDEIAALHAVPIFANLDAARLKLIAFTSERLAFGAGDNIFRQGEASDAAYVLLSGEACVELATAQGPIALGRIGRHALAGEMGVITGAPRSASVTAATPMTVLRLPGNVLLGLLDEFPQIALSVMRDQIARTVAAEAKLAEAKRPGTR